MLSFLLCLALLVVGYFTYGKLVDKSFGADDRETPAVRINDGVDYVVMEVSAHALALRKLMRFSQARQVLEEMLTSGEGLKTFYRFVTFAHYHVIVHNEEKLILDNPTKKG